MAVVDTTKLARYHAIFPELTEVQANTCLLLSMGLPVKTVAVIREVSPDSVKQTIMCIRDRLGVHSLADVRMAGNVRLTLAMMEKML